MHRVLLKTNDKLKEPLCPSRVRVSVARRGAERRCVIFRQISRLTRNTGSPFFLSLRAMGVLSGTWLSARSTDRTTVGSGFLEIITNRDGERPARRTNEYSGVLGAALRIRRCVNGPEK